MNLDLDLQQAEVDELFRSFFTRECPPAVVRSAEAAGFAPALWARLIETGAPAIAVAEANGGGGAGLVEAALMAEAAGRRLAPVPLVEHLVVTRLLERVGRDQGLLAEAVAASVPMALALHAAHDVARHVSGGAVAEAFVVHAGGQLLLSRGSPPGPIPNTAGLPLADRTIEHASVLADVDGAANLHAHAIDEWKLLTAAMLVGLADAALEIGVAYVSERHQFGVPIGSFQAIQHGLAELAGPLSGARLLVRRAAWRIDAGELHRSAADASMAFLFAAELARTVTARVLHYHGGYGVMEEQDIQLHYRRARGWPAQLGDPVVELSHLADHLYGPVVAA